jgi:light-regulated signal transduction histidine kinase (bacteriophytochrome)
MPLEKSTPETPALEMQQFLQSAVHDLRAAQRQTSIAAELLLASNGEKQPELVAQILQGLSKSEQLLIAIGRYANTLAPARYPITLFPSSSAVRFALSNLDPAIRHSSATIVVGDLPEISADRDRLAEVFEHLVGNSLKFKGPDPPIVEIAASPQPDGWRFSVTDNGIGIPFKYRDRLFIPFRRLQGAEIPGAGLGLAISRKIVEAHGGRIWIEDPSPLQASPGVKICFLLPRADGA